MSNLNLHAPNLDKLSVNKFFKYNLGLNDTASALSNPALTKNYEYMQRLNTSQFSGRYPLVFMNEFFNINFLKFMSGANYPNLHSIIGAETDSKSPQNSLKFLLNTQHTRLDFLGKAWVNTPLINSDLHILNPLDIFNTSIFNKLNLLKFKELKSSDLSFLNSERNTRLLKAFNSSSYIQNFSSSDNATTSLIKNLFGYRGMGFSSDLYDYSKLAWPQVDNYARLLNNIT